THPTDNISTVKMSGLEERPGQIDIDCGIWHIRIYTTVIAIAFAVWIYPFIPVLYAKILRSFSKEASPNSRDIFPCSPDTQTTGQNMNLRRRNYIKDCASSPSNYD